MISIKTQTYYKRRLKRFKRAKGKVEQFFLMLFGNAGRPYMLFDRENFPAVFVFSPGNNAAICECAPDLAHLLADAL